MFKSFVAVMAIALISSSCGKNPHVETKDVVELATPAFEPSEVAPLLKLREKESKREGLFDFAEVRKNQKVTKFLELVNLGLMDAQGISIPATVGPFKIENINCGVVLAKNEACDLKAELIGGDDARLQENFFIYYLDSNPNNRLTASAYLVATVRTPTVTPSPVKEPKIVIIPKNHSSGTILLKDTPVDEKRLVHLEIRNIGEAKATNVRIPLLPIPYVLKSNSCTAELEINQFCELIFEYAPKSARQDNLNLTITSSAPEAVQPIIANAVVLSTPAKLEVVDGTINQDVYDLLGIKPDSLSPYHEIRAIDVGVLMLNKPLIFKVHLQNIGASDAKVTDVRGFQTSKFSFNAGPFPGKDGNCSMDIKRGQCSLDIKIDPTELKNMHDMVELTYTDGRGQTRRLSVLLMASVKEDSLLVCKTLPARPMPEQDAALRRLEAQGLYKLPYKTRSTTTSARLQLLYNLDSNHNLRFTRDAESVVVPWVKNAMVQFGFNITKEELEKYKNVRLELDILKIATEGVKFDTTEVLCMNENRMCSGSFFIDSNYGTLNTRNYTMHSNYFSTELLRSTQERLPSLRELLRSRGELSADAEGDRSNTIFRLRKRFPLSDLVGDMRNVSLPQGLNFVLADDSLLLGMPRLILETDEAQCALRR